MQIEFEREFDKNDPTAVAYTFTGHNGSDFDQAMRTFGPLPPTKRLVIDYPKRMQIRFRVVDADSPAVTPAKPVVEAFTAPAPSVLAEVLSRARALETWKRADLETRAAEVGVSFKKNATTAALAAMVAQAEHEKPAKP